MILFSRGIRIFRGEGRHGSAGPTRYGEIARWFITPAAQRPLRPGGTLTRRELADRLITSAAGPDQLRRALAIDPANLPARLALSRHATRSSTAELLRRWTRRRLLSPPPEDLRRKIEAADRDSK